VAKKMRGIQPMKAGSFRDSVAKTVRLLTRDQVRVIFRGFQPCVATHPKTGKVLYMVLPEVGDNASAELVEAMQGFLDHECGHIFFTPFKRTSEILASVSGGERKLRAALLNIVEDIRLEKLLPRELPGTKDNLERTYDAVMERFWGKPMRELTKQGADAQTMLNHCIVPGFRALAGQKAFQKFMDANGYWQHLTPLTSRMPTFSKELQEMETYADVERIVEMILNAMEPIARQQVQEALENAPPEDLPMMNMPGDGEPQEEPRDDAPEQEQEGAGEGESDEDAPEQEQGDGGDAGDDEGNSSEGDEADEGEGGAGDEDDESADTEGSGGDQDGDDKSDDKSADDEEDEGGKGHGDGSGEDDGSDEEGGSCSGDEEGEGEDEDDGDGGDADTDEEGDQGSSDSDKEGKTNRSITDALKQLEPTQRKVLYLHKNKKRSVTRIAEKMQISEDEVKSLLGSARRSLASIMTGAK
jgi:hypothetical protein